MMSEVLSYLIMITCILIRVSSKEVKWTVCDPPPKLGQDLTLFCKVDNCTVRETKRWHGGPDNKLLMLNSGISTDKTKYSTSIEKNGFILTILDLTVKDLNISYTCSCGLVLDNHILYIEDVYTVDNLNKTINDTNYIRTNDVGGISLYVYIAIPVILVILLIIVIVKRHWLWGRLKEKIYGTGRRNTDIEEETPMNVVEDNLKFQSRSQDIEEETPMNVVEDNLKFQSRSQELLRLNTLNDEELKTVREQNEEQIRNLQTKCGELLGPNTLKDEELKTERKQKEEQIRNLQTKCRELLSPNTLKDEELKTERKQNGEQIRNLGTICGELLTLYTLKDEELKTERKQNGEQIRNLDTIRGELLTLYTSKDEELKTERKENGEQIRNLDTIRGELHRSNTLEADNKELKDENKKINNELKELKKELLMIPDLRTEMKQNKEKYSVTIARFETQIKKLQAKYDEECEKLKKAVGKLEREKERVEEEARDEYEEGIKMVKARMETTEEVKRKKSRLEEDMAHHTMGFVHVVE